MNKEFIPYEQALELKELGFDEHSWGACYYEFKDRGNTYILLNTPDSMDSRDGVKAPLYQQAFRWFREKHQLFSWVLVEYEYGGYSCGIYITGVRQSDIANGPYSTYEEAELACLKKLIEIVKNK
jgi:hypothetical protein